MQCVQRFVPGRKTDVKDAQRLCQLLEAGLLKASLVPPKPIRTLRNLTRCRNSQTRDRQREANRLHKVMQDTGIKLDCVASDLLGKSGRAMLDALVAGTTDPAVLADLARGQLRKKIPALQEALEGGSASSTGSSSGASWRTRCCGPCSSALGPPDCADRGDRAQVLDQHPVDGESALA
jgi:transposase